MKVRINDIVIGTRARKDMGDLAGLAESIKREGLLHPIVVRPNLELIAGERRIEACRLLEQEEIEVTVVNAPNILTAERDENEQRKNFTPTEAIEIGRQIEERQRELNKSAGLHTQRHRQTVTESKAKANPGKSTISSPSQEPRVVAARAVGYSPETYTQMTQVVRAAERDPEHFGDLLPMLNTSVLGAYRELRERQARPMKHRKQQQQPKPKRHPVLRKTRYVRYDKLMTNAVTVLEQVAVELERVPLELVPQEQVEGWAKAIHACTVRINRIARRLSDAQAGIH